MIALSASLFACALLLAGAWVITHRNPDRVLAGRLRERVLVTTKVGATFSGVLFDSDDQTLLLVQTVEAATGTPVDGELLIRWSEVAYVQKP